MKRIGILTVLCIVLAIASMAPAAGIVNGSFETGDLTGWSTSTTGFGTVQVVTSFDSSPSWLPTDGNYFAVVITDAGQPVPGSTNPQLMYQTAALQAGSQISFDYFFDQDQTDDDQGDIASILLNGTPVVTLATPVPAVQGNWSHFVTSPLPSDGAYEIVFGDQDGTGVVESALGVDNVQVTGPVPEPLTMLAVFSGISGLGVYLRRRRA